MRPHELKLRCSGAEPSAGKLANSSTDKLATDARADARAHICPVIAAYYRADCRAGPITDVDANTSAHAGAVCRLRRGRIHLSPENVRRQR